MLAAITRDPSGVNRTDISSPVWLNTGESGRPVSTSHTRAVESMQHVTIFFPSGLNAAPETGVVWCSVVPTMRPVFASHTRAARPLPAVATRVPVGLNPSH